MKDPALLHPRHWPSWAAVGLLRLLVLLPWPLLMATGGGLGRLIHLFALRRRQIAEINLQRCLPELDADARRRLIRTHFASLGKGLMEVGMAWWWPQQRLERRLLGIEGEEHLPPRDGRGTIFLTAHFSSLELSGRYLGARRPTHAMYRPNENPVIQALFERHRRAHTLGIIPRDDVRGMIRALRAGEGVWFAPDQNYGRKGKVFADFMGVPAATHTATSRFARATGAQGAGGFPLRGPAAGRAAHQCYFRGLGAARPGAIQLDPSPLQDPPGRRSATLPRAAAQATSGLKALPQNGRNASPLPRLWQDRLGKTAPHERKR